MAWAVSNGTVSRSVMGAHEGMLSHRRPGKRIMTANSGNAFGRRISAAATIGVLAALLAGCGPHLRTSAPAGARATAIEAPTAALTPTIKATTATVVPPTATLVSKVISEPTETPSLTPTRASTATTAPTVQITPTITEAPTQIAEKTSPPVIAGLTMRQNPTTGRIEYFRGTEKVPVAYYTTDFRVGTQPVGAGQTAEFKQGRAVVVVDTILMAKLVKDANPNEKVNDGKFRIPLPFTPSGGMNIWVSQFDATHFSIALGNLPPDFAYVQPFGSSVNVIANDKGSFRFVSIDLPKYIIPSGWENAGIQSFFVKGEFHPNLTLNILQNMKPGARLATHVDGYLPSLFKAKRAQGILSLAGYVPRFTIDLSNVITIDGAFVAVGIYQDLDEGGQQ